MESIKSRFGYNENGHLVATKVLCNKENCNCQGFWYEGNEGDVFKWEDEEKEERPIVLSTRRPIRYGGRNQRNNPR